MTSIRNQYNKIDKNFMTPRVRDVIETEDGRLIELSEGEGIQMNGSKIYGVSEFELVNGRIQSTRRGQMHHTINSARKHFNVLK